MNRWLFIFILTGLISYGRMQSFDAAHDSLQLIQHQLFKEKNDDKKNELNKIFISLWEHTLKQPNSFSIGFDSLKEVGRLISPDKQFRIINWNLAYNDGTYGYFGFIQSLNPKTKQYNLYSLSDKTSEIKNPESTPTTPSKWYGMLYYKIVFEKQKRKKSYILLGWKGKDKTVQQKIIEPITFDSKGVPKIGGSILEIDKKHPQRVIFEYSAAVTMSLKYNETSHAIIFDHLAPKNPMLEGQYQYYGPDMSFDGFVYKKGKWIYVKDVDARNPQISGDKNYIDPKNGKDPKKPEKEMYSPK